MPSQYTGQQSQPESIVSAGPDYPPISLGERLRLGGRVNTGVSPLREKALKLLKDVP